MEIELSEKHDPLFDLLEVWSIIFNDKFFDLEDNEKFAVLESSNAVEYYNESFLELSQESKEYYLALSKVDTVLEYGGRDSGKSFATSLFVPIAVKDYGHRCLYTRYVMNTTDHSITSALDNRIDSIGATKEFTYANNSYELVNENSPGKIFVTGQKTSSLNQTAKLKSLEDFTLFITDEAEEIKTFDEWNKIKRSMRGKGVQNLSILSFNPPTKDHWLHEEFFEDMNVQGGFSGIKDNILYVHTTYKDNIEHVQPNNLREYNKLESYYNQYLETPKEDRENLSQKIVKGYKKYKNEVLGGFRDTADGVIYEDWEIGEFNYSLPNVNGLDFGFDDPDAMVKVAVDNSQKIIYLDELIYRNGLGTNQLADLIIETVGNDELVIADSAHKRLIRDLYFDHGINIKKCRKGGGSVNRGIKTIQGYKIVVTARSKNIIRALNNYLWHDKRAGVPMHDHSHIPDAFRYAVIELVEY